MLVAAGALTSLASPADATSEVTARRLAGADRYQTAAAIARVTFPGRSDGEPRAAIANVARGDAFPDALSAVNINGGSAPTLLTARDNLPQPTAAVLRDFGTSTVNILGQPDVVTERVRQQIADLRITTHRRGGNDRYATAAIAFKAGYNFEGRVLGRVDGLRTAFIASGVRYADAMSAGPLSYQANLPLLLSAPDELLAVTRDALMYDGGLDRESYAAEQVVVVGGPAVVSDNVVREIEALGITVRRVAGSNRQETAIKVFEFAEAEFAWKVDHVNLARGDGFADAIAGGPHAGEDMAPVLLTVGVNDLGSVNREFLRRRSSTVASIDVFGDSTAVSDAVVADAKNAAGGQ